MAMTYPPIFINEYLKEKVSTYFGDTQTMPFFPTTPTNLEDLTSGFPDDGTFAVYDRMLKYRRSPFPHIKCEQLLYYFYKTVNSIDKLIETVQHIYDLLDNEDESAQDLNEWIKTKLNSDRIYVASDGKEYNGVFFHSMKVFQLQETRDIVNFGTARTYAGNKIIVDYEYHKIV